MLRRMMLRRKTIPRPGSTLCEPAQSKCTWTLHNSHFVLKFTGKVLDAQFRDTRFLRACAVKMHTDISQEPFCMEIYRKNGCGHLRGHRFVRACAVEMHMDISQEPLCAEIYRQMPDAPATTSIKHRALTLTVRNPSAWPLCLRKNW